MGDLSKYTEECCDCGLVHDVWYRVVDGKVEWKCRVNRRETAKARLEKAEKDFRRAERRKRRVG